MRGMEFAQMSAFLEVAERRSFVKAAAELGVSSATLSQNLRALEERLGVRLLNRTTRSVAPTIAGQQLMARLGPAFDEVRAAIDGLSALRDTPAGLVRLTLPPPAASLLIAPILSCFTRKYPAIRLEIEVDKSFADIVNGRFDAGIRFGRHVERDMVAVRISDEIRLVAVAAPDYLLRYPTPKSPQDLKHHNCIRARLPNGAIWGWEFEKKGKKLRVAVDGSLIVNEIDLVIRAALDGAGVAYLLRDYVDRDIAAGTLIPLLDDWSPCLSGFYLYHLSRRQLPAPLQIFIDFIKDNVPQTRTGAGTTM
jgi:DNA-binding transcriptional LysR family regulator